MLGRFGLAYLSPSQTNMDNYNFTRNDLVDYLHTINKCNKRLLLVSKFTRTHTQVARGA